MQRMQQPLNYYTVESPDKEILIKMMTYYKPIGTIYQDDSDNNYKGFWVSDAQLSKEQNVNLQLIYDSFDHFMAVEQHWTFNAENQNDFRFYLLQ